MQPFLLGCALGAAVAACVAAPLVAPWPMRVRCLVAAPMTDPLFGLALSPRLDMRAVTLAAIESGADELELTVEEIDCGRASRLTLARATCAPSVLAELDGWMAMRPSLLQIIEDGKAHLYGPDGAVTDLGLRSRAVMEERIR